MNKVILIGNLGNDAESFSHGLKFSIATSESYKKDEEDVTVTQWHRITMFVKKKDKLLEHLVKGKRVCVEGMLTYSTYEGTTYCTVTVEPAKGHSVILL